MDSIDFLTAQNALEHPESGTPAASKTRRKVLLQTLAQAQSSQSLVPVTVFGFRDDQGNGSTAVLAYWRVASSSELAKRLLRELPSHFRMCDAVVGFVTQQQLESRPDNEAWSGLATIWPEFEALLPSAVRQALDAEDPPPGLSFCQVFSCNWY